MTDVITIASDGGCSPNPGRGGWAYVVFRGAAPAAGLELRCAGGALVRDAGFAENATNNTMELTGLIKALEKICEMLEDGDIAARTIRLHLDSQYTLNAFFDWIAKWKRSGWRKSGGEPVLNRDFMERLDELRRDLEGRGVLFEKHWVKGHCGDYANELVDQMLTRAREQGLSNHVETTGAPPAPQLLMAEGRDLAAENRELRAALEPFALALRAARERLGVSPDRNDLTALACRFISCEHLRAAAAALERGEGDART